VEEKKTDWERTWGWSSGTMWPASNTRRNVTGPTLRTSPIFFSPTNHGCMAKQYNARCFDTIHYSLFKNREKETEKEKEKEKEKKEI
jgi:hypothetical protein